MENRISSRSSSPISTSSRESLDSASTIHKEKTNNANFLPLDSTAEIPKGPLIPRTTTPSVPPPKPPRGKVDVQKLIQHFDEKYSNKSYDPIAYFPLYASSSTTDTINREPEKQDLSLRYLTLLPATKKDQNNAKKPSEKNVTYVDLDLERTRERKESQRRESIARKKKTFNDIQDNTKSLGKEYETLRTAERKVFHQMEKVINFTHESDEESEGENKEFQKSKSQQANSKESKASAALGRFKRVFSKTARMEFYAPIYKNLMNFYEQIESAENYLKKIQQDLNLYQNSEELSEELSPGRKLLEEIIIPQQKHIEKLKGELRKIFNDNKNNPLINELASLYEKLYTPRDGIRDQWFHVQEVLSNLEQELKILGEQA